MAIDDDFPEEDTPIDTAREARDIAHLAANYHVVRQQYDEMKLRIEANEKRHDAFEKRIASLEENSSVSAMFKKLVQHMAAFVQEAISRGWISGGSGSR